MSNPNINDAARDKLRLALGKPNGSISDLQAEFKAARGLKGTDSWHAFFGGHGAYNDDAMAYWLSALTTTITDSFNRADNTTSLGSTDTGQPWTANTGTWGINSNRPYVSTAAGVYWGGVASIDTGLTNQDVTITFTQVPASSSTGYGIVARLVDANNFWYTWLYKSGGGGFPYMYAGKFVAGVENRFIDGLLVPSFTPPGPLRLVCAGNVITAYLGGVSRGSTTDSAFNSATRAGLLWNAGVVANRPLDDFVVVAT